MPEVGQWVDNADILDLLPVGTMVMCPESQYGDHIGYQKTTDTLHENYDAYGAVWASIFYSDEQTSEDLINLSHDGKVLVVYVKPA